MPEPSPHHVVTGAIPEPVVGLCQTLRAAGYKAWVVGGSLRDVLRGGHPKDWDLATSARPEQLMRVFKRVVPTGIAHGTVTVLLGKQSYELTTLRGEGAYSDSRRPDEVFFVDDIEQDLARRDFTVNAVAYDPFDDRLIDPFGGLRDLAARVLRTVGVAEERFGEDGLRVLRAARFAATLEFEIEPATLAAIPKCLDAFRRVSKERVRDEWLRAMEARVPSRAFDVMRGSGILAITCPELVTQFGCTQNRYHAYDVWHHSLACLDASPARPLQRMAALLHDLGKPRTRALSEKTSDYTFYNHESVGADLADVWLREYRFSNEERSKIVHLVRHHLICYSNEWTDAAVRRFVRRVGPEHVDALLELGRADALGKGRPVDDELAALEELRARIADSVAKGAAFGTRDLAIDGRDVMLKLGIRPGPRVGQVLENLLERVLERPELNERDTLLGMVESCAPAEPEA
ncbi:MAG TPA: HD domain-containing protein [Polyangiales bacterium]|nr:HD domain-containing protein [Polyangiales bacterium]